LCAFRGKWEKLDEAKQKRVAEGTLPVEQEGLILQSVLITGCFVKSHFIDAVEISLIKASEQVETGFRSKTFPSRLV
jgi:hypothetical protein